MTYVMIDAEADGPIPGDYSMISFGAILVDDRLDKTFYGRLRSISEKYNPEAFQVSGHTLEETLGFEEPAKVLSKGVPMVGFTGAFSVNFEIPNLLGLGKSVSRGFGTVKAAI